MDWATLAFVLMQIAADLNQRGYNQQASKYRALASKIQNSAAMTIDKLRTDLDIVRLNFDNIMQDYNFVVRGSTAFNNKRKIVADYRNTMKKFQTAINNVQTLAEEAAGKEEQKASTVENQNPYIGENTVKGLGALAFAGAAGATAKGAINLIKKGGRLQREGRIDKAFGTALSTLGGGQTTQYPLQNTTLK